MSGDKAGHEDRKNSTLIESLVADLQAIESTSDLVDKELKCDSAKGIKHTN